MLVLSRTYGEEIVITGPCTIRVCDPHPSDGSNIVRLGIIADPSVKIWRGELIDPATGLVRPLPFGSPQDLKT